MSDKRSIGLSVLPAPGEVLRENHSRIVEVEKGILARNDELAASLRDRFAAHGLRVLNLLSSPGSGKTTLLSRTLSDLRERVRAAVIVGDLETENDARRLQEAGVMSVQITTGGVCHLEAAMVARAADALDLAALDLLVIENVGNLVCPAAYDLGESERVVLLSVTEGEDKPLKYPRIFKSASLAIITKVDIADAVGFDRAAAMRNIRLVSPEARILEVSARTGFGLEACYEHLTGRGSS